MGKKRKNEMEYTDVKCMCGHVMVKAEELKELDERSKKEKWTPERISKEIDVLWKRFKHP